MYQIRNPIENFLNSHPIICPCHSQTMVMAAIVFFAKVPEWHQHYDQFMDSLYLTATSRARPYIFFQHAFVVPIFSPLFDPVAPFLGVPLYIAHPDLVSPHPAQPPAAPPQYTAQGSSKNDQLEMVDSSSSSSSAIDDSQALGDPGSGSVMANEFLSSKSAQWSL